MLLRSGAERLAGVMGRTSAAVVIALYRWVDCWSPVERAPVGALPDPVLSSTVRGRRPVTFADHRQGRHLIGVPKLSQKAGDPHRHFLLLQKSDS